MTKDVTVAELGKPAGDLDLPVQPNNDSFGPPRMKWDPVESLRVDRGQIREPITFPDPALGRLGDWTPPSLYLDWDPVPDLVAERDRHR